MAAILRGIMAVDSAAIVGHTSFQGLYLKRFRSTSVNTVHVISRGYTPEKF